MDPKVGLYASFIIAVMTAFFGGRPGMISAATGAMALLMITLVKSHGLEYLFAATILTGVFQLVFWDASAVAALDRVVLKFRGRGVAVTLLGLNEASATLLGRIGTHDKPGASLGSGH